METKWASQDLNQDCLIITRVLSVILANEMNLSDVCWLAEQVLIGKESAWPCVLAGVQVGSLEGWAGIGVQRIKGRM